jgi:type II restriction enzyme
MINLDFYRDNNLNSDDEVFEYLLSTMRPGVADWEYFVNWDKVFNNTREIETTLNVMNYLLGKEDFDKEFHYLADKYPEILRMIPVLIVRNGANSTGYHVVTVNGSTLTEEAYNFGSNKTPTKGDIDNAIRFIRQSGLIKIFAQDGVHNLVDYVLGVEAGLSSNGRKNRGGNAMENVCEALLEGMGLDYKAQASDKDIKERFGVELKGMGGRRFDFATSVNGKLFVFEVNCYTGGGSKLDKTASDYRTLQDELRGQATFIWLTDGYGWLKTRNPLRKSFDNNDYILNIEMINKGALKEILNS